MTWEIGPQITHLPIEFNDWAPLDNFRLSFLNPIIHLERGGCEILVRTGTRLFSVNDSTPKRHFVTEPELLFEMDTWLRSEPSVGSRTNAIIPEFVILPEDASENRVDLFVVRMRADFQETTTLSRMAAFARTFEFIYRAPPSDIRPEGLEAVISFVYWGGTTSHTTNSASAELDLTGRVARQNFLSLGCDSLAGPEDPFPPPFGPPPGTGGDGDSNNASDTGGPGITPSPGTDDDGLILDPDGSVQGDGTGSTAGGFLPGGDPVGQPPGFDPVLGTDTIPQFPPLRDPVDPDAPPPVDPPPEQPPGTEPGEEPIDSSEDSTNPDTIAGIAGQWRIDPQFDGEHNSRVLGVSNVRQP